MGEGRSFGSAELGHIDPIEPVDIVPSHSNIGKPNSSWVFHAHVVYKVDEAALSLSRINVQDV